MLRPRFSAFFLLLTAVSLLLSAGCRPVSTPTPPPTATAMPTSSPTPTNTPTPTPTPDPYTLSGKTLDALAPYVTYSINGSIGNTAHVEGLVDMRFDVDPKWKATTMEGPMQEKPELALGKFVELTSNGATAYIPAFIFNKIDPGLDLKPLTEEVDVSPKNPGELLHYMLGGREISLQNDVTGVLGGHLTNPAATRVYLPAGPVYVAGRVDPDGIQDGDPSDDLVLLLRPTISEGQIEQIGEKVSQGKADPTYYYALASPKDVPDARVSELPDDTAQFHKGLGLWMLWSHVVLNNVYKSPHNQPFITPRIDNAVVLPPYEIRKQMGTSKAGLLLTYLRNTGSRLYNFAEGLAVSEIVEPVLVNASVSVWQAVGNAHKITTTTDPILDAGNDLTNVYGTPGTTVILKNHNMTLDQIFGSYAWIAEHPGEFNRYKGPIAVHGKYFPETLLQLMDFNATKELLGYEKSPVYLPDIPEEGMESHGEDHVVLMDLRSIGSYAPRLLDGFFDEDAVNHSDNYGTYRIPVSSLKDVGVFPGKSPEQMKAPGIFAGDAESLAPYIGKAPAGSLFVMLDADEKKAKPFMQELLDSGEYDLVFDASVRLPYPYYTDKSKWPDFLPKLYDMIAEGHYDEKLGEGLGKFDTWGHVEPRRGPFGYPADIGFSGINYQQFDKKINFEMKGAGNRAFFASGIISRWQKDGDIAVVDIHSYGKNNPVLEYGWDPLMLPFTESLDSDIHGQLYYSQNTKHMDLK